MVEPVGWSASPSPPSGDKLATMPYAHPMQMQVSVLCPAKTHSDDRCALRLGYGNTLSP